MSLHLPIRRVAQTARVTAGQPSLHLQYLLPRTQRRHAWFNWGSKNTSKPLIDEMTKRERQQKLLERMSDNTQGSSIFDEEIKDPQRKQASVPSDDGYGGVPGDGGEGKEGGGGGGGKRLPGPRELTHRPYAEQGLQGASMVKEHTERARDPDPRWRIRYQKKKIIQMMRNADKPVTREERIRRTERELTSKSEPIPTSTKKLVHLAHQIVGKTLEDAIVQMRFSKKKMAREVRFELEEARDHAIAERGMGLGRADRRLLPKPRKIQTKDGEWLEISDPTGLYVDESWVNKGPYRGARIRHHARGRMSMQWRPTSRINLVLKEEKTRIRQHDERVEKEAKKAPWVHLPNRPVTAQRPYYSW